MKKILTIGMCVLALAACEKKEPPLAVVQLKCGEHNLTIKVFDGRIDATIDGETLAMPQVVAASGAKYQFENLVLWNKGESWTMTLDDGGQEMRIGCMNISADKNSHD